jgi:hypothetical protein
MGATDSKSFERPTVVHYNKVEVGKPKIVPNYRDPKSVLELKAELQKAERLK